MRFHCANGPVELRSFALQIQGRVQLVTLGWYFQFHNRFAAVRRDDV